MRVLVIEDDPGVAQHVRRGLEDDGHMVDSADDGAEGLAKLRQGTYDVAVLDVMLPRLNGSDVAARFRAQGGDTPILMLTARDALSDRLEGFNAGADDYLAKPFAMQELLVRLKAIVRRSKGGGPVDGDQVTVGDLVVDAGAHEAYRAGKPLNLTPREFALLEYMARHEGRALSRSLLLDQVWGASFESFGNVVDATVRRLRRSVDEGFDSPMIHTIRGVGYKLSTRRVNG